MTAIDPSGPAAAPYKRPRSTSTRLHRGVPSSLTDASATLSPPAVPVLPPVPATTNPSPTGSTARDHRRAVEHREGAVATFDTAPVALTVAARKPSPPSAATHDATAAGERERPPRPTGA